MLLSFFKTFNPNSVDEKMNPLWTQFSEANAVKSKMHIKYPDMATVYANGHDMINKNGGFFWNMRFKFDASYLKTLKVSVAWWGNNMTSNAQSRPSMTSTKWLTQNPKVFLNKVNKVIDDKNINLKLWKLDEDVKKTIPNPELLFEKAEVCYNELKEETESLKYIVTKEKLHYLERERRKILDEINNHKPKQETHQLSLGAL